MQMLEDFDECQRREMHHVLWERKEGSLTLNEGLGKLPEEDVS